MIDFNAMIDNHLKREHRPKGIGRYYPSEIGMCMRKTFYSYKFPTEIKPDLVKIFEVGNILHDFVVDVLKSEKTPGIKLLKSEFPFEEKINDFTISGRIDDLILLELSGKEVLVEVKSTGNIDFVREAMHHNVMQLQLYMHLLKIHNGVVLYIDKRNLQSKVFSISYDENEAKKILDRFKALHTSLTKDYLPDPEARASREGVWMCKYCEYREKCYEENPTSTRWL
jgi:CRISPR/Cas system-associated exonuclease Cas4 (RecB family)